LVLGLRGEYGEEEAIRKRIKGKEKAHQKSFNGWFVLKGEGAPKP